MIKVLLYTFREFLSNAGFGVFLIYKVYARCAKLSRVFVTA